MSVLMIVYKCSTHYSTEQFQ